MILYEIRHVWDATAKTKLLYKYTENEHLPCPDSGLQLEWAKWIKYLMSTMKLIGQCKNVIHGCIQ